MFRGFPPERYKNAIMLIEAKNITKGFLADTVLNGVCIEVRENDRIGLLGVNGAGKTTLLNILAGDLRPDEGTVVRAKNLEIGYLRQNDALSGGHTLGEEAKSAFSRVYALEDERKACAAQLAEHPGDESLLVRYDALHTKLEAADIYHLDDKISRVFNGLGFQEFSRDTLVSTLSGGEKMRFGIAKMLLREPDVLILDEPTNHLDFTMLGWLEEYLAKYKGAVLVVSHDRYFLDSVAKDVCEIERGGLTRYTGGYTGFVQQKAERRRALQKAYDKQQVEIAAMEDYIRRNSVRASTANMARSRANTLEKMERVSPPPPEAKTIKLQFTYDLEPFSTVLKCENLGVAVGEGEQRRTLYDGIGLEVLRGEKMALVGLNGVGKTTFLKAVQNMVPHTGLVQWGGNVRVGYFDQELSGLPMDETVLEAVHSRFPVKTEFEIRSALGRMLIEGEAVYKKVRELSGANRAKVAFAILLMQRANVLVLDEPTNHLDYRAKDALEDALAAFPGTVLAVSHDRYFLNRVPSAILEMHPGGFTRYNGNYDYYKEKSAANSIGTAGGANAATAGAVGTANAKAVQTPGNATGGKGEAESAPKQTAKSVRERRAESAAQRARTAALEKEIARLEAAVKEANEQLAAPENASDYELLAKYSDSLKADTAALETATDEWLALVEKA